MTSITIACLDMAGTTVADDGSVMAAFTAALDRFGPAPGSAAHDEAMRIVHDTMGQSKIEVFREILGDEATAQHANDAFEDAYAAEVAAGRVDRAARGRRGDHRAVRRRHPGVPAHRVLAGDPGRGHRPARLAAADRPRPVPGRRGARPALARPAAHRAAAAGRRRGQRARRGRRHAERHRVRPPAPGRGWSPACSPAGRPATSSRRPRPRTCWTRSPTCSRWSA